MFSSLGFAFKLTKLRLISSILFQLVLFHLVRDRKEIWQVNSQVPTGWMKSYCLVWYSTRLTNSLAKNQSLRLLQSNVNSWATEFVITTEVNRSKAGNFHGTWTWWTYFCRSNGQSEQHNSTLTSFFRDPLIPREIGASTMACFRLDSSQLNSLVCNTAKFCRFTFVCTACITV